MAQEIANLQAVISVNTNRFRAGMAGVDAQMRSTATAMGRMDKQAQGSGAVLGKVGKVAAVGLVAGLTASVVAAASFDKQMAQVRAVTNVSGKALDKLRSSAITLSSSQEGLGYSANEVAQAQTELGKAGLSVQQIMGGGMKAALVMARAGAIGLGEAAAYTANAMAQFNLSGKDAGKVADAMAVAANKTTADVGDFGMALTQGGAAAKSAGLSFTETMTALTALANMGVKGSDAGTSLKAALIQLVKPTNKQAEAAKAAGISFVDQNKKMKSLADISQMLRDRTAGMTKVQRTALFATLAGTDGVRTLLSLYNAGPAKIKGYTDALTKQGAAQQMASTMADTFSVKLDTFKNQLIGVGIQVGDALLPALSAVLSGLSSVVGGFRSFAGVVKENTVLLTAFGAVVGGIAFGKAAQGVMALANSMKGLAVVQGITSAMSGMGGALGLAVKGVSATSVAAAGLDPRLAKIAGGVGRFTPLLSRLGSVAGILGRSLMGAFGGPVGMAVAGVGALIGAGIMLHSVWANEPSFYERMAAGFREVAAGTQAAAAGVKQFKDTVSQAVGANAELALSQQALSTTRSRLLALEQQGVSASRGSAAQRQQYLELLRQESSLEGQVTQARQRASQSYRDSVQGSQAKRNALLDSLSAQEEEVKSVAQVVRSGQLARMSQQEQATWWKANAANVRTYNNTLKSAGPVIDENIRKLRQQRDTEPNKNRRQQINDEIRDWGRLKAGLKDIKPMPMNLKKLLGLDGVRKITGGDLFDAKSFAFPAPKFKKGKVPAPDTSGPKTAIAGIGKTSIDMSGIEGQLSGALSRMEGTADAGVTRINAKLGRVGKPNSPDPREQVRNNLDNINSIVDEGMVAVENTASRGVTTINASLSKMFSTSEGAQALIGSFDAGRGIRDLLSEIKANSIGIDGVVEDRAIKQANQLQRAIDAVRRAQEKLQAARTDDKKGNEGPFKKALERAKARLSGASSRARTTRDELQGVSDRFAAAQTAVQSAIQRFRDNYMRNVDQATNESGYAWTDYVKRIGPGPNDVQIVKSRFTALQETIDAQGKAVDKALTGVLVTNLDSIGGQFSQRIRDLAAKANQLKTLTDPKNLTPAEAELKAFQEGNTASDRAASMQEAQGKLAEAQMWGDAAGIRDAQKQIAELERQQRIDELTRTAEAERTARDEQATTLQEQINTDAETLRTDIAANGEAARAVLQFQYDEEKAAAETHMNDMETQMSRLPAILASSRAATKTQAQAFQRSMAKWGDKAGLNFADNLAEALATAQPKIVKVLASRVKDLLELHSPAKKGPLSTIDTWWSALPQTLASGVDGSELNSVVKDIVSPDLALGISGSGGGSTTINLTVTDNTFAGMSRDQADRVARDIKAALDRQVSFSI